MSYFLQKYILSIIQRQLNFLLFLSLDLIEEPKELWNMHMKTTTMWLDLLCVFPFEIFCFVYSGIYDRWIAATLLRSNRMFKMYKVRQRHFPKVSLKKAVGEISESFHTLGGVFYLRL